MCLLESVQVVICDTVREPDGLALSSRNAYLSPEQRTAAQIVYKALLTARDFARAGCTAEDLRERVTKKLLSETLVTDVEYVMVEDWELGVPIPSGVLPQNGLVVSCAVAMGDGPRLIDNIVF